MHSFSVYKPSSATCTSASISTATSQDSQLGTADEQQPRCSSFMGLLTTPHKPEESSQISSTYYQQDELRLLSDISASKNDRFEVLATHQTVTFDNNDHRQSVSTSSLSNEPSRSQKSSQSVDDVTPIVREVQSPNPTDKWIIMSGNEKRPYQCGHKACGRKYSIKAHLQTHFITHTGDSKLRCHLGNCAGRVIYRDTQALTRHMQAHHFLERPFRCEICDRRFKREDHLKCHTENVHLLKRKKKSPRPHSVSKSSSAMTTTITASTSTMTSRVSQPESAAGQRQQRSCAVISTTIDAPKSIQIPTDYQQHAELRLLADISTSQINPFAALATHETVTFDDQAVTTGFAGAPNLLSDQCQAEQSPDPTDEWIIVNKLQEKPYKCAYPGGCDKSYLKRCHLIWHFKSHTGKSKFKCSHPECVGNEYFRTGATLKRHIFTQHTSEKPFQCDICERRFGRKDHLKHHRKHVHGIEEKKKSPNRKRK